MASDSGADNTPPLSRASGHFYKAVKCTEDPAVFRSSRCGKDTNTLWRVGETNTLEGADDPVLCERGFHACRNPVAPFLDILGYGYNHKTDVLLEVALGGKIVTDGIKTAATLCTPLRVLPAEELHELMRAPAVLVNAENGDEYHVKEGKLHRDGDKPALIWADGSQEWCKYGKCHRDGDAPARIWADGTQEWCKGGKRHRDGDKPARIWTNGSQAWYKNGALHRDGDKPAYIDAAGTQRWYKHGLLHRDGDKPALIWASGIQEWFMNGLRHRDGNAPARIWPSGRQEWYKNGMLHRDGDAPGRSWASGRQAGLVQGRRSGFHS